MIRVLRWLLFLAVVLGGNAGCRENKTAIPTKLQAPPKDQPKWNGY